MSVDLHALIPLIALTFLLAGFVKGVVGLGLPTVSVGLLGLAMPPMQAAALLIVPSMVTNLWQLACGPRFLGLMKRLAGLLLGVIVGTLLVGAWLGGDAPRQATGVLGLALAAYALLGLGCSSASGCASGSARRCSGAASSSVSCCSAPTSPGAVSTDARDALRTRQGGPAAFAGLPTNGTSRYHPPPRDPHRARGTGRNTPVRHGTPPIARSTR